MTVVAQVCDFVVDAEVDCLFSLPPTVFDLLLGVWRFIRTLSVPITTTKSFFERDRRRFGLHNFRHRLSSFGEQGEDRTQNRAGILRHSRIQTTLDLYTQEDTDKHARGRGNI